MPQTPTEFRLWEDPEKWITRQEAFAYVGPSMFEGLIKGVLSEFKVCIIPGGEIADGVVVKNEKGEIRIRINGKWQQFPDEDTAYQTFLEQDHCAS